MTAGEHEAAAAREGAVAAEHQGRYDPSATQRPPAPSPGAYSACISNESSNCYVRWGSETNPTEGHRKEAEHHRKLAAQHRAASKALVDAEERFCSGIAEADRDSSPFYHREDITSVGAIKRPVKNSGYHAGGNNVAETLPLANDVLGSRGLLGARITFRAVPGMSGEWLQRVVDCHLARNAVIGDADQSMSFCPLAVPHATANVMSVRGGFAVDVTSDDEASVREIVKRAAALVPAASAAMK